MERVYGKIRNPDENSERTESDRNGLTEKLIQSYENRIALQNQLTLAHDREMTLLADKSKLLDLLSAEKEEKCALMPLLEEKEKVPNWLLRLVGAR